MTHRHPLRRLLAAGTLALALAGCATIPTTSPGHYRVPCCCHHRPSICGGVR